MKKILEVCVGSAESAITAQSAGADRIEFCSNLAEGGTTPTLAEIEPARIFITSAKLYAMVRPRAGDFLYSNMEFEVMKAEVTLFGKAGCDGVVIGMLKKDGSVDVERCSELVGIAKKYSMGVTFHRAFDRCNDLYKGLEDVIKIGCDRILTSGGAEDALSGADIIRELVTRAAGRITIIGGAGITPENIAKLANMTGLNEFHGTFQSRYDSEMAYRNTKFKSQMSEYTVMRTDVNKVREAIRNINKNE